MALATMPIPNARAFLSAAGVNVPDGPFRITAHGVVTGANGQESLSVDVATVEVEEVTE